MLQATLTTVPSGPYAGQQFKNPQPLPLNPDTADFRDRADTIRLGTLGVFSIDRTEHRVRLAAERSERFYIEGAYAFLGQDRTTAHNEIAAELEGRLFGGIWARSTREYAAACRRCDRATVKAAVNLGYGATLTLS
jgi:hypothetical protein